MADEEQQERDDELDDEETSAETSEGEEVTSEKNEQETETQEESTEDEGDAKEGSTDADQAEEEASDAEDAPDADADDEDEEDDADAEVSSADDDRDESGGGRDEGGQEEFEESVVHVNRCCKVVQGGKVFSFSALVVAGNRNGKISYGFGKANQVPQAIQKAIQDSRERVIDVPIVHGTIPHRVELEYCSTELLLRPASPGTGVIASLPVRTTLNLAGITDLLTKIYGSTNPINCVKAVYEGLKSLRTKEEIEELRDVKIT